MKNRINIKLRMRNKQFLMSLIALLLVFANQLFSLFGVDITFISHEITKMSETVLIILGLLGIIDDPTVDGFLKDSKESMERLVPKKDE